MDKYGVAAVRAVHIFTSGLAKSPRNAWLKATTEIFSEGTSSQKKGCPQSTFLGLCEEGLVSGIPFGQYTKAVENKKYALDAVSILKKYPELASDLHSLWNVVMRGKRKVYNSQMDVVVALWNENLLVLNE